MAKAISSLRKLDPETRRAAQAFMTRVRKTHGPVAALLYGSRARGTHTAESDADIAVILKGRPKSRFEALGPLSDAAYDVFMETGIYIQPFPLWESELKRPESAHNPQFFEHIKRDGVPL